MKIKKLAAALLSVTVMSAVLSPAAISYAYQNDIFQAEIQADSLTGKVVSAEAKDGKTVVKLDGVTEGMVIAAKFNGNVLDKIMTAAVSGSEVTVDGIEATRIYVWDSLQTAKPLCSPYNVTSTVSPIKPGETYVADFTAMSAVPVYSDETGAGFVSKSNAIMPEAKKRSVAPASEIKISSEGAKVTESSGSYIYAKTGKGDGDDYNNGGLIYRIYTGAPGAYHIEVEATGTSADTWIAPTGMQASRLTGTGAWDTAGGLVPRTVSAVWNDNVWSFDFGTGEKFIDIEIEPATTPTANKPQTVGVKKIKVTPIAVNAKGAKPTIHILGDSTQKTYNFNEQISSWGQNLINYFDPEKVNVINYSMGGRAMKSSYNEGRFNEVLIRGKAGDFIFIHSAHNDETKSTNRFSRGAGVSDSDTAANNANYNNWLDMYVEAIKARGMTPVLVTGMPRMGSAGFDPDSPGNMRLKAASDEKVGLSELFTGAKTYSNKLSANELKYIYNYYEAGETPANNYANGGNPDGTHYREAASKQWCRIMLQSIYDQSVAAEDTYRDKAIMQELVGYMKKDVQEAAASTNHDWSKVFPEMASDVSAVDVVPGAEVQKNEDNFYYRNNIEKALQLGLLSKTKDNLFKPTAQMTVGEFARSVEKVFELEENSLTSYTKTANELGVKPTPSSAETASISEVTSASDNNKAALAADEFTVTITQPEGGTVTVYNESAFHTATTDIKAGIKADSVLADNEYYVLTAPTEVTSKTDNNGVFTNKAISTSAVEVRNNGTKQIKYKAKASGVVTLYLMFVDHKIITAENKTDNSKVTKYINDTEIAGTTKANLYNGVTFNVEAGKDYEFYTYGGTGRLFGIMYASNDYPQSTESLTVNPDDEIRVVAAPNKGYMNNQILVNGEGKSTSKEFKFKVTSNITVTASFTKEPELVESTVIPSDAALTREAMGAIIYDAYLLKMGKKDDGSWNQYDYMGQNGGVPSPDDPGYDPNIKYEGSPYIPLSGWGALQDINDVDDSLYYKVKEVYNLGLIRSEKGIARGSIACGNILEPKTVVTRAKAAKALVFMYILTQPTTDENQRIYGENHINRASDVVVDAIPEPAEGIAALPVK